MLEKIHVDRALKSRKMPLIRGGAFLFCLCVAASKTCRKCQFFAGKSGEIRTVIWVDVGS